MKGRRTLLRTVGSVVGASIVGTVAGADSPTRSTAPGAGRPGNDDDLAVDARGELVGRIERSGAAYVHRRTFHSEDLAEHYGDPTFEYEPVEIPREHLSPALRRAGGASYRVETTRVIGRADEQHNAEMQILRERSEGASTFGDPTGTVPLFSYASSTDAQRRLTDRAAPINLAWADGPATRVRDWMQEYGWTQELQFVDEYSVDQYVNLGGDLLETDAHVMDTEWDWGLTTEQDHVRLYDLPGDPGDVAVVGQVHHDPIDHNKVGENVGPVPLGSWEFVAARERAAALWTSHDSSYEFGDVDRAARTDAWTAGNVHDDVDSHDGTLLEIHNEAFGVPDDDCGYFCELPLDDSGTGVTRAYGSPSPVDHSPRPCACSIGF